MAKNIQPVTLVDIDDIDGAIACLKTAVRHLQGARCPKAVAAVRRALKSVEGAQRHAWHRLHRNKP